MLIAEISGDKLSGCDFNFYIITFCYYIFYLNIMRRHTIRFTYSVFYFKIEFYSMFFSFFQVINIVSFKINDYNRLFGVYKDLD